MIIKKEQYDKLPKHLKFYFKENRGIFPKEKTQNYEGCDTKCKICNKYFLSGSNPCTCDPEIHGDKAERAINPKSYNNHPTIKPLQLIYKLAQLFKLPDRVNQKVYIPFCGVFSEIIGFLGAEYKDDNIYGCELNKDYIDIGEARKLYWIENNFYFKNKEFSKNHDRGKPNELPTLF